MNTSMHSASSREWSEQVGSAVYAMPAAADSGGVAIPTSLDTVTGAGDFRKNLERASPLLTELAKKAIVEDDAGETEDFPV